MKKVILSIICVICLSLSNTADAQMFGRLMEEMPPYKLGVTAGLNFTSFSAQNMDTKPGFNIGVDFMIDASNIKQDCYFRFDLLLQQKGSEFLWQDISPKYFGDIDGGTYSAKAKVRTYYLEVPAFYGKAWRVAKDWAVMAEMGPYIAIGLGGNYKTENFIYDSTMDFFGDVRVGKEKIVCKPKRIDLGWGFAFATMYDSTHQLKLGYQVGFINMNDTFLQNRNAMISYSYFFE